MDSAGIAGYHIGSPPDQRSIKVCEEKGIISIRKQKARQLSSNDFETFDFIFCMDNQNLIDAKSIQNRCTKSKAKIALFGSLSGKSIEIEDPYYGKIDDFHRVLAQCDEYSLLQLNQLKNRVLK